MLEILLFTLGGFVLILIDMVLLPGAVLAVTGSGMILYSVFLTYAGFGIWPALTHFAIALAAAPKLVIWGLNRVALKNEMTQEDGYTGLTSRKKYIGQKGQTLSPLRPSGSVEVDTGEGEPVRLDCISESGYIDEGQSVVVVEERGPSLVVRLLEPN